MKCFKCFKGFKCIYPYCVNVSRVVCAIRRHTQVLVVMAITTRLSVEPIPPSWA